MRYNKRLLSTLKSHTTRHRYKTVHLKQSVSTSVAVCPLRIHYICPLCVHCVSTSVLPVVKDLPSAEMPFHQGYGASIACLEGPNLLRLVPEIGLLGTGKKLSLCIYTKERK